MRWNELFSGISYKNLSLFLPLDISDVSTDSGSVESTGAFVCIRGTLRDGADFLGDVLKRGCRCIVIDRRECLERLLEIDEGVLGQTCIVMVDDCREAYALLCRNLFGRPDEALCIIGITGTKGKTTSSSYVAQLLRADGLSVGVIGTCGAQWGEHFEKLERTTPDAKELFSLLARMKDDGVTHVVMEVSSIGLKQKRVCGISFRVGVFTNFYPDHIGPTEHEDMEEYFFWKRQLFNQAEVAVIPHMTESPWAGRLYRELVGGMPTFTVGDAVFYNTVSDAGSGAHGSDSIAFDSETRRECLMSLKGEPEYIRNDGSLSQRICVKLRDGTELFQNLAPGSFQIKNYLNAAAVVCALGFPIKEIDLNGVPGRMELVCKCNGAYFYVDYAHNAEALREALHALKAFNPHRLICVFGCGGNRSRLRRGPMGSAATELSDLTIITEDNSRDESFESICEDIISGITPPHKNYIIIEDRARAIKRAAELSEEGDIVLIAGKGHEDYMERQGKRTHFMDAEEIIKYVSLRKHNH